MPEYTVFLAIALYITIGTTARGIQKSAADNLPIAKASSLQFFFAGVLALLYAFTVEDLELKRELIPVAGMGFVVSIAVYAQWRATAVSLSKTSIFTPLSGVITAILALSFLKESSLFQNTPLLVGGVATLITAAILLSRTQNGGDGKIDAGWIVAVSTMIFIFGFVQFGMKWFANENISSATFLSYWYPGAFLGSLVIVSLRRHEAGTLFQARHVWKVPIISLAIVASLSAQYWAYQLAPASFVAPVLTFGLATLPVLVGLWGFGERKKIGRIHVFGFLIGVIGVIALTLSRY